MNELLVNALMTVATAGIGLLSSYLILFIRRAKAVADAEISRIAGERQRELAIDAFDRIENVAEQTVFALEQTTAKALREAVKSGDASAEKLKSLAIKAYHNIRTQLKPEYISAIENGVEDFEAYLMNLIESKVLEVKAMCEVITLNAPINVQMPEVSANSGTLIDVDDFVRQLEAFRTEVSATDTNAAQPDNEPVTEIPEEETLPKSIGVYDPEAKTVKTIPLNYDGTATEAAEDDSKLTVFDGNESYHGNRSKLGYY
jgi:hypothetical protein